jgi:hypothetical protein
MISSTVFAPPPAPTATATDTATSATDVATSTFTPLPVLKQSIHVLPQFAPLPAPAAHLNQTPTLDQTPAHESTEIPPTTDATSATGLDIVEDAAATINAAAAAKIAEDDMFGADDVYDYSGSADVIDADSIPEVKKLKEKLDEIHDERITWLINNCNYKFEIFWREPGGTRTTPRWRSEYTRGQSNNLISSKSIKKSFVMSEQQAEDLFSIDEERLLDLQKFWSDPAAQTLWNDRYRKWYLSRDMALVYERINDEDIQIDNRGFLWCLSEQKPYAWHKRFAEGARIKDHIPQGKTKKDEWLRAKLLHEKYIFSNDRFDFNLNWTSYNKPYATNMAYINYLSINGFLRNADAGVPLMPVYNPPWLKEELEAINRVDFYAREDDEDEDV